MHNRSACESDWNFSSRWFADEKSSFSHLQRTNNQEFYQQLANPRKQLMQTLVWSNEKDFFMD